jgi:predicted nucleic acid-binding protein
MFLVDTSVWIGYLRQSYRQPVRWFEEILDRDLPFGITGAVFHEVLQGADSEASFKKLREFLGSQRFYHPVDPVESHAEAAAIYFRCRRAGVTVRSTIDCWIARIAIENDLLLLHDDRDFDFIASVVPELHLYEGRFGSEPSSEVHEEAASYDGEPATGES